MVVSCSAPNCKNRYGKLKKNGKKLQFHRFPLHNRYVLEKWIEAVNRKNWKPTKNSSLCGDHFIEADYASSAFHYLKQTAVPSIFSSHLQTVRKNRTLPKRYPSPISNQLKSPDVEATTLNHTPIQYSTRQALLVVNNTESLNIPTSCVKNQTGPEQNPSPIPKQLKCIQVKPIIWHHIAPQSSTLQVPVVGNNTASAEDSTLPKQRPSSISHQLKCPDVTATTSDPTTPQCVTQALGAGNNTASLDCTPTPHSRIKMLQRKVKILQDRLRRRDKKIAELESMLSVALSYSDESPDTSRVLKDNFDEFPCEILMNMLYNKSKNATGRRYTKSIQEFAATLYNNSPSAYKFLRPKLSLPHPSFIRAKNSAVSKKKGAGKCNNSPVIIPITKE